MAHLRKTEYEALADFRHALRQFQRYSERAAESAGLTAQQHQALLAIRGFHGRDYVTVGELAERLQIRPHSAVELVDRLSAEKLVIRRTANEDRRQVRVTLTARGLGFLERLSSAHKDELRRIGPNLRRILDQLAVDDS